MSQHPAAVGSLKPVIVSLPDLTKPQAPMMDKEHAKYAVTRATAMLGFYRKDDAWDPEMFLTGISAVLAKYPREIIEKVTHPADGLPSKLKFPPTPAEVKEACEHEMIPIRRRDDHEARERARLRNREPEIDRSKRATAEEIKADLAKRGFVMGERGRVVAIETPDMVKAKLGITNEQWNAIPDQPESMRNRG